MSLSCTVWLQWGLQEVPLCHKIVIREENKSIHVQQQQQQPARAGQTKTNLLSLKIKCDDATLRTR